MANGYGGGARQRIFVEDSSGRTRREARVAADVTIDLLVPALAGALGLPQIDGAGRAIVYGAVEGNREVSPQATLQSAGIGEGATLVLLPVDAANGVGRSASSESAETRRLAQAVADEVFARLNVHVSPPEAQPRDDTKPRGTLVVRPTFGVPDEDERPRQAVFVARPSGVREVFDEVVRPLLDERGLTYRDAADAAVDARESWAALLGSHIVVADCTGRDPEVFYDLARAHVLGKPSIVLAQAPADLPRSVSAGSAILYTDNVAGLRKLRNDLTRVLQQLSERPPAT